MLYFIVNPLAGSGRGAKVREIITPVLKENNVNYEIYETEYAGHAVKLSSELSLKEDCEAIVAAGGDGTFCEVLNGLNCSVPLGLIPCGTGNDFATGMGVSTDVLTALDAVINGVPLPVDFMSVGDDRCLNVAGIGFDTDVLINEKKFRKVFKGKSSYYVSLFLTLLFMKFKKIKLRIDDVKDIETDFFLFAAANGKFFGGGMPLAPYAEMDDGFINAILVRKLPRLAIPKTLIMFLKGKLQEQKKYVEVFKCRRIECAVDGSSEMEIDGEIKRILPAVINLHSHELNVFRKKKTAAAD